MISWQYLSDIKNTNLNEFFDGHTVFFDSAFQKYLKMFVLEDFDIDFEDSTSTGREKIKKSSDTFEFAYFTKTTNLFSIKYSPESGHIWQISLKVFS